MEIRRPFGSQPQQEIDGISQQNQSEVEARSISQPGLTGLSVSDSLEVPEEQSITPMPPGVLPEHEETGLPNLEQMPVFGSLGSDHLVTSDASLAMILNYLGVSVTPEDIFHAIGRGGMGETPEDMIDFARSQGLSAQGYNNGTIQEIKQFIDQGLPVMAAISDTGNIANEMIAVTGYGVDNTKTPPEEYVVYRDGHDGIEKRMPMAEFETRWKQGGPEYLESGYENYFMVIGPEGTELPAGRDDGTETTKGLNNGTANVFNGIDRIIHAEGIAAGERFHGVMQTVGGGVQWLGGGIGWLLCTAPSQWLNDKVEGIPVLENFVQPIGDLWNTAGAIVGDLTYGVGEALDSWGGAFEALGNGDFKGFGLGLLGGFVDLGTAVADTIRDTVGGVIDTVGDIFSGW